MHDHVDYRGQTLPREAVRYVVQQDSALTLYGAWWEPLLGLEMPQSLGGQQQSKPLYNGHEERKQQRIQT